MEKALVKALATLFGDRVFPDVAPMDTEKPFCIYQQVGGTVVNYLEAVPADKKNARMQITVWADTREEAMNLIRAVEDILVQKPFCATPVLGAQSTWDDDTGMRGAMQDFLIWDIDPLQSDAGENYTGDYLVIPSTIGQVLKTKGKMMRDDVTITAIPTYAVSNDSGTTYVIGENNGNQ